VNYVIRRWYDIGLILAVSAIIWAIVGDLDTVQLILLLNFVMLVLHQLEEMRWPGGTPWILNEVFNRRGGPADRFPLNQANCAFINIAAWAFYLVPVFFPGALWLGLAQGLFGMVGQLVTHGLVMNIKLKTMYNPGLATVVFGHVPLGICYLIEVRSRGVVSGWQWLFGALLLAAFVGVIMLGLGYGLMADKNTRYPFEPREMNRWNRLQRLSRAGIAPLSLGTSLS
jgi:Protein of unknown function with HXXEE motif